MKKYAFTYCLLAMLIVPTLVNSQGAGNNNTKYAAIYGNEGPAFSLATGSPGSLGLLKALAEPFCDKTKCRIGWVNIDK